MEILKLISRELKITYYKASEVFNLMMFFLMISFAFSFASNGKLSIEMAVSVLLVCFMLSANLSSQYIFEKDIESGVLHQLFLRIKSINSLVFAKILSQFLFFGLPLCLVVPISSVFLGLDLDKIFNVILITMVSSFIMSVVNVTISAITVGLKSGGVISIILSLPLYIPVIIANISYVSLIGTQDEISVFQYLQNAIAYIFIIVPLAIFAVRVLIRNAID
jgi:heme exporter protein B